jgi:ABC-2 type transport system ATP-binding protein
MTTHYLHEADRLADRVLVLAGGRIVADTTPADLRARGGPSTIRFPLPPGTPIGGLPPHLRPEPGGVLVGRTDRPNELLRDLLRWADRHGVDLSGLEVGPPSLEDAYLTLAGATTGGDHDA